MSGGRLLGRIGGIVLASVLSLLVVEGVLRFYHESLDLQVYNDLDPVSHLKGRSYPAAASDYLPFTTTPNMVAASPEGDVTFRFNALGYVGTGPRQTDKRTRARLMLLGDSYTLGWSVSYAETFAPALEKKFGADVEVINAAYHAGYSLDAYYAYLKKEGLALAPDAVVVMLNYADVEDLETTVWLETDEIGGPTRLRTTRRYTDPNGRIISGMTGLPWVYGVPYLRNSYVFVNVGERLSLLAQGIARWFSPMKEEPGPEERFTAVLQAFKKVAGDRGISLTVGLIAPPDSAAQKSKDEFGRLVQIADKVGVTYINFRPLLITEDFMGPNNHHFSPKGHAVVADIIFKKVCADLVRRGADTAAAGCEK